MIDGVIWDYEGTLVDPGTVVYIGDHETDAHCAYNANKTLGKKKIIAIGAFF